MTQPTRPSLSLDLVQLSLEDEHFPRTSITTTPGSPRASTFPLTVTMSKAPQLPGQLNSIALANGFTPLTADQENRDYEPFADRPPAYDNWRRWVEINVPQKDQWANEPTIKPVRKPTSPAPQLKQGSLIYKKPAKTSTDVLRKPSRAKLAASPVNLDWDVKLTAVPCTPFAPVLDLKTKRPKLIVRTELSLPTLPASVYQPPPAVMKKRPAPLELFSNEPIKTQISKRQRMYASPMPAVAAREGAMGPGKWSALRLKRGMEEKRKVAAKGKTVYEFRTRREAVDRSFGDK